jgi:hypothetical protein
MKRFFKALSVILSLLLLLNSFTVFAETLPHFRLSARGYCGFNYLQWEKVENAHSYYIYRGIGPGNQSDMPLTDFPVKETSYKDTKNIVNGTSYCYIVVAFDENNNRIATSNEACATPSCPQEAEDCKKNLKYQIDNTMYWVNDVEKGPMETSPVIRWDRMFLLIRYVAQEVGASIDWDGTTRTVSISTLSGTTIEFQIGNNKYKLNGQELMIDPHNPSVVPFILEGRSLMPLRVTAESLDTEKIEWHGDEKIAELIFRNDGKCDCICPCPEYAPYNHDYCMVSGCEVQVFKNSTSLTHAENQWVSAMAIPCSDADVKGWRRVCNLPPTPTPHEGTSADPFSPWEGIYKNGGCWIYPPTSQWNGSTNTQLNSVYRHPFKLERCTHLKIDIFVDDKVDVYLDTPAEENKIGSAAGVCSVTTLTAENVPPGEHSLIFVHHNTTAPLYGLIYGVKCVPCDTIPEDMGRIVVRIPDECLEGTIIQIFDMEGNEVWSGGPNEQGVFDTDCILPCPATYKVIPRNERCVFYPESQAVELRCCPEITKVAFKCDCEGEEPTRKLCGCIVRMTLQPDANGFHAVYFKKDCAQGDPVYDLVIQFPDSLLDNNLGMTVLDYFNSVPGDPPDKHACIDVWINSMGEAVEWEAHPDRNPCCPDEEGGRIIVKMERECLEGTTVYIFAQDGTVAWQGMVNDQGVFDTGCTLKCPAVYKVVPKNERCVFHPEAREVKVPCCPEIAVVDFKCECEEEGGRIIVRLPKECIEGTVVYVYDQNGNGIWKGTANEEGLYDTGCTLPCPAVYKVVPKNEKCTFYPESQEVKVPCCPDVATVTFKCECKEEKGRIVVKMPSTCIRGTTVYIYDQSGKAVWKGTASTDEGIFDTGCTLPCPATYKVVPKNDNCKFYPESQEVKVPCCPEVANVTFKCECRKTFSLHPIFLFFITLFSTF